MPLSSLRFVQKPRSRWSSSAGSPFGGASLPRTWRGTFPPCPCRTRWSSTCCSLRRGRRTTNTPYWTTACPTTNLLKMMLVVVRPRWLRVVRWWPCSVLTTTLTTTTCTVQLYTFRWRRDDSDQLHLSIQSPLFYSNVFLRNNAPIIALFLSCALFSLHSLGVTQLTLFYWRSLRLLHHWGYTSICWTSLDVREIPSTSYNMSLCQYVCVCVWYNPRPLNASINLFLLTIWSC